MIRNVFLHVGLASAILAGAGCRHGGEPTSDALAYSSWHIVAVDGQPTPLTGDLLRDDIYAVDFGTDAVVGYGGCNRFSASYSRAGDRLQLGPVAGTRRACPEPVMGTEYRLLQILAQPLRIETPDARTLVLTGTDGAVRLRRSTPQPD
jgi:heat shock protein HslJ